MKTHNKKISIGKKVLKSILGFAIGMALGYGFVKLIKTDSKSNAAIESTIHRNKHFDITEKQVYNL